MTNEYIVADKTETRLTTIMGIVMAFLIVAVLVLVFLVSNSNLKLDHARAQFASEKAHTALCHEQSDMYKQAGIDESNAIQAWLAQLQAGNFSAQLDLSAASQDVKQAKALKC